MGWVFVPGLKGLDSLCDLSSPPTEASVWLKGKPLRQRSWSVVCRMAPWMNALSGMTLSHSTADAGVDSWIFATLVPRARTSPAPDAARESTASVPASGGTSSASSRKSSRSTSSSRTSAPSSALMDAFAASVAQRLGASPFARLVDGTWTMLQKGLFDFESGQLQAFAGRWPKRGTWGAGIVSKHPMSARPTAASGSSSSPSVLPEVSAWQTPTGEDADGRDYTYPSGNHDRPFLTLVGQAQAMWATPSVPLGGHPPAEGTVSPTGQHVSGAKRQVSLGMQTQFIGWTPESGVWPTPDAQAFQDGMDCTLEEWDERRRRLRDTTPTPNGNGCGTPLAMAAQLWATPNSMGGGSVSRSGDRIDEPLLAGQAEGLMDSLWGTPRATDGEKGGPSMSFGAGGTPLPTQAVAASEELWATPRAAEAMCRESLRPVESIQNHIESRGRTTSSNLEDDASQREASSEAQNWMTPCANPEAPNLGSNKTGPASLVTQALGAGLVETEQERPATWALPTSRDAKDGACETADVPTNGLLGRQVCRSSLPAPETPSLGEPSSPPAPTSPLPAGEIRRLLGRFSRALRRHSADTTRRSSGVEKSSSESGRRTTTEDPGPSTMSQAMKRLGLKDEDCSSLTSLWLALRAKFWRPRLSPKFVEMLQGLPENWTSLGVIDSGYAETWFCRCKERLRCLCCGTNSSATGPGR